MRHLITYILTAGLAFANHAARNETQHWTADFDPRGFTITTDTKSWTWGLELQSYGFTGNEQPATKGRLSSKGDRVTLHRDGFDEWFVNDARGLEQGFTVHRRPEGTGDLHFDLKIRGGMQARVRDTAVQFATADGAPMLSFSGLKAWDADGKTLATKFERNAAGLRISVDEREAKYPITIDPIAEQALLHALKPDAYDNFGFAVAISGDTVAVGAPYEDNIDAAKEDNGAVYIFVLTSNGWMLQARLRPENATRRAECGKSVAISGDTLVVGCPYDDSAFPQYWGGVDVYKRTGALWNLEGNFTASTQQLGGGFKGFGQLVAISGNTIAVACPDCRFEELGFSLDAAGAIYVFDRVNGVWIFSAKLVPRNVGALDFFGRSIAIDGDTIAGGAANHDYDASGNLKEDAGAAYVFTRSGGAWSQQAYLTASNRDAGDYFGGSVSLSGNSLAISAGGEDSAGGGPADNSGENTGAIYLFSRSGTVWTEQTILKATDPTKLAGLGSVVNLGDTIVAGAPGINSVYKFARSGGAWSQTDRFTSSDAEPLHRFGTYVAASGNGIAVGVPLKPYVDATGRRLEQAGAAYVLVSNTTPTIIPIPVTRQQGASGSAHIATVNDAEDPAGLLPVTIETTNPLNGVTISAISNTSGNVTANVAASCAATSTNFTLRVVDSRFGAATANLPITVPVSAPAVNASVTTASLAPPNSNMIAVGLTASATGACSPTVQQIRVYANEDDQTPTEVGTVHSPDARNIGNGTLRLRAERAESGNGRVYLIVVRATNTGGTSAVAAATVVVPKGANAAAAAQVAAMATSARNYALANNGNPPPGYFTVGDGPVVGPKQ